MKRFTFRFAAVLKQRTALLDQAKAELGDAIARCNLAVDILTRRRQDLATLAAQAPTPGQPFDPQREVVRQRHLGALRQELERRQQMVERLEAIVDAAREKVAETHRGLRAIELLEERDREAWKAEARRLEQQENDERNAQRFGR
ncbi:MAG: flagellar export protein FliJ [Myxococcales bacterium]|nr:flagellar export protein FliJ [Myxococcales bacterium]MCB9536333.1 flagellar export protein FliJ [Myxococcales bacterium]